MNPIPGARPPGPGSIRLRGGLLLILALSASSLGREGRPGIPFPALSIQPQDPSLEELIEQLGSESIQDREKAAAKLRELGRTALPALEAAARSRDAETAGRAEQILGPLRSQIAQETFQAIEGRMKASPELRARFTLHLERRVRDPLGGNGQPEVEEDAEGEFVFKEPQKIHAVLRNKGSPAPEPRGMVSDGAMFATRREGAPWNRRPAPGDLRGKLTAALVRSGLGYWWTVTEGFLVRDPRSGYELSDFRPGAPEGNASTILYKLHDGEHLARLEVKLCYDPKTLTLLKRTLEGEMLGRKWSSSETTQECPLEGDLPKEFFQLPDGKQ